MFEMNLDFAFAGTTYRGYGVSYPQQDVTPDDPIVLAGCGEPCFDIRREEFVSFLDDPTDDIIDHFVHQKELEEEGDELPTAAYAIHIEVVGTSSGQLRLNFDGEETDPLDIATLLLMGATLFEDTLSANIEALPSIDRVVVDRRAGPNEPVFDVYMIDPNFADITGTATGGSIVVTNVAMASVFENEQGNGFLPHLQAKFDTWRVSSVGSPTGLTFHLWAPAAKAPNPIYLLSKHFCPPLEWINVPNGYTSTVGAGDRIDVSLQAKWSGSVPGGQTFKARVQVDYYGSGGVHLFDDVASGASDDLTTSWEPFLFSTVVPSGALYALVTVSGSQNVSPPGAVPDAKIHIGDLRYALV